MERAEAMLRAAKTAEAMITSSQNPTSMLEDEDLDGEDEASTVGGEVDINTLTAQTFLVRPTRPDANRNRGKKNFKRRPPAANVTSQPVSAVAVEEKEEEEEEIVEVPFDESLVEEMEVLQLGLEEAWFLASALGVLRVFDPKTVSLML
jgi:tRNA-splicing endonuclease subunit Sen2